MKVEVRKDHCNGCVWLGKENVCMFQRCVRHHGFAAEKGEKGNGRTTTRI